MGGAASAVRALRGRTYGILVHEPSHPSPWNHRFHLFLALLIIANIVAVFVEMHSGLHEAHADLLHAFDIVSVAIFSAEWLLRLWVCVEDPRYRDALTGRARYLATPLMAADLLAVLPFYIPLLVGIDLRFLRALRLLHFVRLYAEEGPSQREGI